MVMFQGVQGSADRSVTEGFPAARRTYLKLWRPAVLPTSRVKGEVRALVRLSCRPGEQGSADLPEAAVLSWMNRLMAGRNGGRTPVGFCVIMVVVVVPMVMLRLPRNGWMRTPAAGRPS